MWRALAAICALGACAGVVELPPGYNDLAHDDHAKHARGDFDGDGRIDRADFVEDDSGNLVLVVTRAAAPNAPLEIWGGDITALERFEIRNAAPGTYHTDFEAYGGCVAPLPESITHTHDGIIVREIDGPSRTLYFWDGAAFQNVSNRD